MTDDLPAKPTTPDDDLVIDERDARLFAYVDDELDAEARSAFEAELAGDARLRARMELLGLIEGEAKPFYEEEAPPAPISFQREDAKRGGLRLRTLAYAAALAIVAGGFGYMQWSAAQLERPDTTAIYASLEQDFAPELVCDTAEKFADYTQDAFGVTIDAEFETDVALVGWRYPMTDRYFPDAEITGPRLLMARSGAGEEVIVFFRASGEAKPETPTDDRLRVHRARVGPVDIYEVSPLDEPVVLGLLSLRD